MQQQLIFGYNRAQTRITAVLNLALNSKTNGCKCQQLKWPSQSNMDPASVGP